MNEYVKAIRSTHLALLGVSGALLSFALSIERRPELDLALNELTVLQTASFDGLRSYPLSTRTPIAYLLSSVKHAANAEGVALSNSFELRLALSPVPDPRQDTLQQAYDRIATLRVFGPNIDDLSEGLFPLIDEMKVRGLQTIESIEMNLIDDNHALFAVSASAPGRGNVILNSTIPVVEFVHDRTQGSWFIDWCKADKERALANLVGPVGNKTPILPYLLLYWNTIKDLRLNHAIERLNQEKWTGAQQFEVFGVKITQRLAVLAGPLVLFLIVFFLYCHLTELRIRLGSNDMIGATSEPWIGLFDHAAAKAVTSLTIILVPALADVLLVVFTDWSPLAWICLTIAGLTLLVGVQSVYQIRRLPGFGACRLPTAKPPTQI